MGPSAFLHPFAPPAKAASDFVTIVRGEGATVWDDWGRAYVDGMASLWYCNIGHGRREVADACADQMRTLEAYHCFDPYTNLPAEDLCATVAERSGLEGSRVFLVSSGSEAVDAAFKLARVAQARRGQPQKQVIVSRTFGYHGTTYGGTSAQGIPANQEGWGMLVPGHVTVPHHDQEAMARLFAERGGEIAAVVSEPVQGAGGVHPPVPGYLRELRRLCDQHGAYLIFDEVICGFGRLGRWFGAGHYDVQPDLMTFAKGVTSGYVPLGGVVVGRSVADVLEADDTYVLRHGHTYSGHPTACVAGLKAIEITEREGLLDRAPVIGKRLGDGLRALEADGTVAEVRGEGAVWAASLHDGQDVAATRDRMRDQGVIVRAVPPNHLTFCPPLVIDDADIDRCVDALQVAVG